MFEPKGYTVIAFSLNDPWWATVGVFAVHFFFFQTNDWLHLKMSENVNKGHQQNFQYFCNEEHENADD